LGKIIETSIVIMALVFISVGLLKLVQLACRDLINDYLKENLKKKKEEEG
jgi:hypothetical protein